MKIGLYDGSNFNVCFDETSTFLGGSETWMLEIAKAFSDLGHEVFIFGNPNKFHTFKNIHFITKNKFKEVAEIIEFDKFIYSRGIENYELVKSKDISLIIHDIFLQKHNYLDKLKCLSKIYVLSEWHKEIFQQRYGKLDNIKITFNGVDLSLFSKTEKTNSMIWSSCFERGLNYFIKWVYPHIKKEISDFELKVCSYNKYNFNVEGIKYLGQLSKNELAKEQCKAKIWCYPNLGFADNETNFKETFCITAVENAAAGNCIITTSLGGLGTTCNGMQFVSNEFYINEKIKDLESYGNYLAKLCIKALKEEYFTSFDYNKFTWMNAALNLLQ